MIHTIEWNGKPLSFDDEDRILVTETKERLLAMMYMPGYEDIVMIPVKGPGAWYWNGDKREPTFSPSVLDPGEMGRVRNHVFVRSGVIEYLPDCRHQLAGKRVELPRLKDWPEAMKYW